MSTLTLIRHGQATPFENITDRLSPLGQAQAHSLGEYWMKTSVVFDEVYTGTLTRQQHTESLVKDVYLQGGRSWPTVQVMPELDEYPAESIWEKLVPVLLQSMPAFSELFENYQRGQNGPNHNRLFQRAFEVVMSCWQEGSMAISGVESWISFRDRVRQGCHLILERVGSSRRVAVFTSGGPIGVVIQLALDAPDESALKVNWRVRNSSLTELLFTRDRLTLDSFNALPHLEDRSLWSYR